MNPTDNNVTLHFDSRAVNVSFARVAVAAFLAPMDPPVDVLTDIKTAVSEAVTNAIIHGYQAQDDGGIVRMAMTLAGRELSIAISDQGVGIPDVACARAPMYTTLPDAERAGLGFTVMEAFMDTVEVTSAPGPDGGTTVTMRKTLAGRVGE